MGMSSSQEQEIIQQIRGIVQKIVNPKPEPNCNPKPKPPSKKKLSVKLKQPIPICAKGYASIQQNKTYKDCTPVECRRRARKVAETQAMGQVLRLTGHCQTYFKTLVNMGAISEDTQLISCEGTVQAYTMPTEKIEGDEVSVEYCGEVVEITAQIK